MIDLKQTRNEAKQRSDYILSLTFEPVSPKKKKVVKPKAEFDDWTVLKGPYAAFNDQGKSCKYADCQCKCGNKVRVMVASLKRGRSKRCRSCIDEMKRGKRAKA